MALKPCPECGHSVSDQAASCPNCGFTTRPPVLTPPSPAPAPRKSSWGYGNLFLFLLLVGGVCFAYVMMDGGATAIRKPGEPRDVIGKRRSTAEATIRTGPGTSFQPDTMGPLIDGETIYVLEERDGWLRFRSTPTSIGWHGWVAKQLTEPAPIRYHEMSIEQQMVADRAASQCQLLTLQLLRAPSTADFASRSSQMREFHGDSIYYVRSFVDAENSFGARIRTPFECSFQHIGGDSFETLSLDVD